MGPQLQELLQLADVEVGIDALEDDAQARQEQEEHEQKVYGPFVRSFIICLI